MSEALSQLNLVVAVAPKQGQALGNGLGAIPTDPATPGFSEENSANEQHGRDGDGIVQDSFAELLEQESAAEAAAMSANGSPGDDSRLADLGLFFAEETPEFLPLQHSTPLEMTNIAGNSLPADGEELPPLATELPQSAIPTTANPATSPDTDIAALIGLEAEESSLAFASQPGLETGTELSATAAAGEADDIFSDLAFLPADETDAAVDSAGRRPALKSAGAQSAAANAMDESELPSLADSEALQIRVQSRALQNQSAQSQAVEGERDARTASAFSLDQNQLRRAAGRDVEFDPQRFGQRASAGSEMMDENRSLHFESQLSRASAIVEKEHILGAVGQGRDNGVAASPASAQPGMAVANAIRQEQLSTSLEQADPEGLERRTLDMRLGTTVSKPEWGEHLGRQLTVMIARSTDQASIQLDPPELGPMQIRLHVQQDQVSLQIAAHHAVVRDAVEQSINRLQQLFAEEGLELLDVNISDDQAQGERNDRSKDHETGDVGDENILPLDDGKLTPMRVVDKSDGKIDYFV